MADSIGEFSLNQTSNAYVKNDDGVVVAYVNYDGTATGFGTVMGTMSFPLPDGGASSGACSWTGQAFPPDRPWNTASGDGTWEQVEGRYAWRISLPAIQLSDGNRLRSEGEIDLEARTFNGQLFEAS
jgi:hypothetical protein